MEFPGSPLTFARAKGGFKYFEENLEENRACLQIQDEMS